MLPTSGVPDGRDRFGLQANAGPTVVKWQTVAMTESASTPRRAGRRSGPPRQRGGQGRSPAPLVELASITTPPELILFNAYLDAERELERERQRLRSAEVAREKAAAHLREVKASSASRDEVEAAEKAWREAHEEWQRVKSGEPEVAEEAADEIVEAADEAAADTEGDATAEAADEPAAVADEPAEAAEEPAEPVAAADDVAAAGDVADGDGGGAPAAG